MCDPSTVKCYLCGPCVPIDMNKVTAVHYDANKVHEMRASGGAPQMAKIQIAPKERKSQDCEKSSCNQLCSDICDSCPFKNNMCGLSSTPGKPKAGACPPCPDFPLRRCNSYELRGGVYFATCDCVKRNGLQLDCRKTGCQGAVQCKVTPKPCCIPSRYMSKYDNFTFGIASNKSEQPICRPYQPCAKRIPPIKIEPGTQIKKEEL